ncbi:MAG: hypothetical protein M3151_14570 [Actinomycetota bacterium]|nr:hypothetical protein [Actinomycetota bacterium]
MIDLIDHKRTLARVRPGGLSDRPKDRTGGSLRAARPAWPLAVRTVFG